MYRVFETPSLEWFVINDQGNIDWDMVHMYHDTFKEDYDAMIIHLLDMHYEDNVCCCI